MVDGRLMLNQSSLAVRVDSGEAGAESFRVVYEEGTHVTSSSYANKTPSDKWTPSETSAFYVALSQYGTDFSMIERILPNRSRKQIKNKFKKEEREHPQRVDDALNRRIAIDKSHYADLEVPKPAQLTID